MKQPTVVGTGGGGGGGMVRLVRCCAPVKGLARTHLLRFATSSSAVSIARSHISSTAPMSLRALELFAATCALLVLAASQCLAFGGSSTIAPSPFSIARGRGSAESTTTSLHIFGNLKGAFGNDESLGKVDSTPGLKGVSRK